MANETSRYEPLYDKTLGWWWSMDEDNSPYRASTKGVFFAQPQKVVGLDLRKANTTELALHRPISLIGDGKAVERFFELHVHCPECASVSLAVVEEEVPSPQVVCANCGGMFELTTLNGYPIQHNWALRMDGRWNAGSIEKVLECPPSMLSASRGAQAGKFAIKLAKQISMRAFAPGVIRPQELVEVLADQGEMTDLNLWFTQSDDSSFTQEFKNMTKLRSLNVGNNRGISDASCVHISLAKQINFLNLEQTSIGDVGVEQLASMPELKWISLTATSVTDTGVAFLKGHPTLEQVILGSTKVTEAGMASLSEFQVSRW